MSLPEPPAVVFGDQPAQQRCAHGVVTVLDYGLAHFAAMCSCGWTGRRRYLRSAANLDAWLHSISQKCDVSVPLVWPAAAV